MAKFSPSKFGGMTYEIKDSSVRQVYLIDTRNKGRLAIYAGPDTSARIG